MSRAYQELGGAAAAVAPKPAVKHHTWRFVQAWGIDVSKHICTRCGTTRVRTRSMQSFPKCRYTTKAGEITERNAPPCV